jgi:hypothetical protein
VATNPYESPDGIDDGGSDRPSAFPWPRIRRIIRPLIRVLVIIGIMVVLVAVVGSRIESARLELREMRAKAKLEMGPKTAPGLSGERPANQP